MNKFKAMIEKRNELVEAVNAMFEKAEAETRAFTADEQAEFEAKSKEIKDIDTTLKMHDEARKLDKLETPADAPQPKENAFEAESRAFADYVRENREGNNWTKGDNGAVIPSTIANKIIETVENIAPIYSMCTKYNVKGSLSFPVYDESEQKHEMAYATEFVSLTSTSGKFTSVSLGGYLAGTLTKISKSLINNAQFDITTYVISKMSQAIARFLEHELLLGTGSEAMTGIITDVKGKQVVTAGSATAISTDDLVTLQMGIPQVYQAGAVWLMNEKTMLGLRKLKDDDGHYFLQPNLVQGFGYTLLGKPIHITDTLADVATGAKPIVYGDMSGLYVNIRQNIEMQMLNEKFADEHAVGVVGWLEMDSKIIEPQKIAVLAMA